MANASMKERVFAGFGAFLFLASACAGVIYIIMVQNASSTPPVDQQAQCTDNQTEESLPAPEVFKPEGQVAELQKTDLEPGTGATAKNGDCLVMKYYGTLASDGTKFDEDFTDTTGFAFRLGQGQVIEGWDQGLQGMKVGGTRRLVIPAAQGYGASGAGSIPPNADLVFVVKLLRIQS